MPREVPGELIQGLLAAIKDTAAAVRVEAAYALGVVARPPAGRPITDELLRLLQAPEPGTRIVAVRVLGRLAAKDAGESLVIAMNDPDRGVRLATMAALGDLREERALQALSGRLDYYQRGPEGTAALAALARIGHPTSFPLFAARADAKDPVVRRLAIEGIGRVGDRARVGGFETAVGAEPDEAVRLAMAFGLQRLGRPALNHLVEGLGNPRTADQAKRFLIELGRSIVPAVGGYLQDPEPAIRSAVADVLGMIGDAPSVVLLEPLRRDRDQAVATAAERAIQRIRLAQIKTRS